MARGMILGVLASSEYIDTASNPMNEKHTTVAPASTAPNCTSLWAKGAIDTGVPAPAPPTSCTTTMTTKTVITRIENTSSSMLTFEVPRIVR